MSSWRDSARCRKEDPSIFFPRERLEEELGEDHPHFKTKLRLAEDKARKFCRECDVRAECLRFQLTAPKTKDDDFGIWGGTNGTERKSMRRRRRRQQLQ